MNKTPIGWVKNPDGTPGYTWNPITGCLNGCEYCYARKLANTRLRERYLANKDIAREPQIVPKPSAPFYPRFWEDRYYELPMAGKAKGIFVCDMSDLFGIGIPKDWTKKVLTRIEMAEQHRFYLLTKQPQNLPQFSPFPDNCWVGVTATNPQMFYEAQEYLEKIIATVCYISLEPFLERIWTPQINAGILDWLIIGSQTKPYRPPTIKAVQEIVQACDKAEIPVFLKNSLKPLINTAPDDIYSLLVNDDWKIRQEMPR